MTLVLGSSPHTFSSATSSTSALLPRLTNWENPIYSARAWSRMAVQRAPDWDMNAMVPWSGVPAAKLAFMGVWVSITPRQLGPTSRMP